MPDSAAQCPLCGEEQRISLAEAWSDHRFLLETCCEGLHDQLCRDMADDPAWARDLLAALGAEDLLGQRLRRLAWNIASQLLGWAAREAACRGFRRIVTYTRADEPGTSLIAAGWTCEARVRGRGWHGRGRARSNRNGWIDKLRWGRMLAPTAAGRHGCKAGDAGRQPVGEPCRKRFARENKSNTLAAQQRQEPPRWT